MCKHETSSIHLIKELVYAFPHIHYGWEDLRHPEDHLNHLLLVRQELGVVRCGGEDRDGVCGAYWTAAVRTGWLESDGGWQSCPNV